MCSVDDDDGVSQAVKHGHKESLRGAKCVKCDEPGVVVTRIHDSFCRSCFQVYVIHKFRAAIGKSKLIREGERVLVAYSGGLNSSALLHLIKDGLSVRAHRKLRFTPTLLHVDESGVLDISDTGRQEFRKKVTQHMMSSGFSSFITDLEQALEMDRKKVHRLVGADIINNQEEVCLFQCVEPDTDGSLTFTSSSQSGKLKSLIRNLASVSSQEDFIRHLRNQLIVCVARQLGFTKVLTAECSTRLSVRILTDVAQGRGSQISLNTAFCDQRNEDVLFIRPVRDLNAKELAMYNSLFGVQSIFIPSISTKTAHDSSIERLTETFITGLQADFSSTVTNIVRTSEKLDSPDLKYVQKCAFCQSPLDTNVGKASALHAVEFSQKISTLIQKHNVSASSPSVGKCQQNGLCQDKSTELRCDESCSTDLEHSLCYGCRLTLQNFNHGAASLPAFITKETDEAKKREAVRERISEFLLEENDS